MGKNKELVSVLEQKNMENNKNLLEILIKNKKQIIIIVVIVFVAFISYKFISSSIQENKEKAVLQEKYNLERIAKEPLEQCLGNVEDALERNIALWRDVFMKSNEPGFKAACEAVNMQYSGKKGNCSPTTLNEVNTLMQEEQNKAEIEKQECYKRYK